MFTQLTDTVKAALFYAIAFGLTLCVALLAPRLGDGAMLGMMFLHMYTPTVAAVLMLLVVTRDGHTRAGWSALGLGRAGLRYWALALLLPPAVLLVVYGRVWGSGVGHAALPEGFSLIDFSLDLVINVVLGSGFALGEEIGFRGYLLPRLLPLGTTRAFLLNGLLHGLWHLPVLLLAGFLPIRGNWLIIGPILVLTLTAAGVLYGFLQLKSGSVWPATLAHGSFNTYLGTFALFTVTGASLALEYLAGETGVLTLLVTTLAAGGLVYWLARRPAPAQPRVTAVEAQI